MKKIKTNRGITLVVLVVTIILLLILAGITISTLSNSGIFDKSKEAKAKYELKKQEEENILNEYKEQINIATKRSEDNLEATQKTWSDQGHFIGEYFYNGKPIYEKTYYISSLPNDTSKKYNLNIENIDNCWYNQAKCFIIIKNTGTVESLSYTGSGNTNTRISLYDLSIDNGTFSIITFANRSGYSAYVTVNYTKTTDEGNGKTIPETVAN